MPEYARMCQYKEDSEYALCPKYAKWMWQGSQYVSVTQGSNYATIWLNMSWIGHEYATYLNLR